MSRFVLGSNLNIAGDLDSVLNTDYSGGLNTPDIEQKYFTFDTSDTLSDICINIDFQKIFNDRAVDELLRERNIDDILSDNNEIMMEIPDDILLASSPSDYSIGSVDSAISPDCGSPLSDNCSVTDYDSGVEFSRKIKLEKRDFKKKPKNMKDCLHVWEHLRDLLMNPIHNGRIIEWISKERGIFKIVQPNEVANLWGIKKANKQQMKYANMARGIRYSREEGGYFDLVSKKDGHGKKLVYKFSSKCASHCDWLKSFMIV